MTGTAGSKGPASLKGTAGPIPFNLTRPQYLELREDIDGAVRRVL